jgi:hypothetical protein
MALRLYNIPELFQEYDVRAPNTSPDPQEHCPFFFRRYLLRSTEESDEYCEPVTVHPCGHYVGKECFQELVDAGMVDCQYCRSEITSLSNPVPKSIQWLVNQSWYIKQVDATATLFDESDKAKKSIRRTHLVEAIRKHRFKLGDAVRLWSAYAKLHAAFSALGAVVFIGVRVLFALMLKLFQGKINQMTRSDWDSLPGKGGSREIVITSLAFLATTGTLVGICKLGFGNNMDVVAVPFALFLALGIELIMLMAGWKLICVIIIINALVYVFIDTHLI